MPGNSKCCTEYIFRCPWTFWTVQNCATETIRKGSFVFDVIIMRGCLAVKLRGSFFYSVAQFFMAQSKEGGDYPVFRVHNFLLQEEVSRDKHRVEKYNPSPGFYGTC